MVVGWLGKTKSVEQAGGKEGWHSWAQAVAAAHRYNFLFILEKPQFSFEDLPSYWIDFTQVL